MNHEYGSTDWMIIGRGNRSYTLIMGIGLFFSFLILHTTARTPRTGDQPVTRPLPTHRTTQTQTHTDIHASSENRTLDPSFDRARTVFALDRTPTVTGKETGVQGENPFNCRFIHHKSLIT
jgi:hypothetical protein